DGIEQRRIAEIVLQRARLEHVEALAETTLFGGHLFDLLLYGRDLAGVLSQLLLQVGALGERFLQAEVQIAQLSFLLADVLPLFLGGGVPLLRSRRAAPAASVVVWPWAASCVLLLAEDA